MSAILLVIAVVIGVVAVIGVFGLILAIGLATTPNRFSVRREIDLGDVDDYLDRRASFAITIVENTPLSRAEVWQRLTGAPYLSTLPLLSGPTWVRSAATGTTRDRVREKIGRSEPVEGAPIGVGEQRTMSGTILSVSQRVIAVEDRSSLTLVGTGLSVPLAIHSFVERFTLLDGKRDTIDVVWEIGGSPRWVGWLPWRWGTPIMRPILGFVLRHVLRLKAFRSRRG